MRQPVQVLIYPAKRAGSDWEYLLLRRIPSRGGFWQGVTGGVEEGEDLLKAAKRELSEETGLVPSALEKIDYSYSYPVGKEWSPHYVADVKRITEHVFVTLVEGQQRPIIDAEEHDEWRWCHLHRALELLKWPENVEALKRCARVVRVRRE